MDLQKLQSILEITEIKRYKTCLDLLQLIRCSGMFAVGEYGFDLSCTFPGPSSQLAVGVGFGVARIAFTIVVIITVNLIGSLVVILGWFLWVICAG